MANQWFRMYAEFATDPKVQMLTEINQRRFVMLLCLKCCNGDVTLHDDEVAFQLRISNDEWLQTKSLLVTKGLIDNDNSPCAWDRRQYVSDSSAARVAKHRAAKKQHEKYVTKCNVTVTPPDTDTDTDTDIPIPPPPTHASKKKIELSERERQAFEWTKSPDSGWWYEESGIETESQFLKFWRKNGATSLRAQFDEYEAQKKCPTGSDTESGNKLKVIPGGNYERNNRNNQQPNRKLSVSERAIEQLERARAKERRELEQQQAASAAVIDNSYL